MAMTPFNGDLFQALKWMQNNAPNLQSLISQKSDWYSQFNDQFWSDWQTNIFDLRTANPFGLFIWCIILGVPSSLFGLYPVSNAWAYGPNRQNYVYSGLNPSLPDPNTIGGNFYGAGSTTLLDLNEVRFALRLRYVALISNGSISFVNKMLRYIFNDNSAWDFPNKNYFYVTDVTGAAQTLTTTSPVAAPMKIEYRIGANVGLSAQFLNLLNSAEYGITPQFAGSSYNVIQEA